MYDGVSSVTLGEGDQSFGHFPKCSVTTQFNFGQPLKATISPLAAVFGRPFKQVSDVRATETLQLPRRNPICWDPASCDKRHFYKYMYTIFNASLSTYSSGERYFDGNRNDACEQAAVESTHKVDWIIVRIN
jgi:hypothetical protein